MRVPKNLSHDPQKKSSHDIKKLSRGSCKAGWRSWHSTRNTFLDHVALFFESHDNLFKIMCLESNRFGFKFPTAVFTTLLVLIVIWNPLSSHDVALVS